MTEEHLDTSWENRRRHKRQYMLFKIPAYDAQTRRFLGLVQDITATGIQLFGVKVDVGSTRTIIIQISDYVKTAPVNFVAECRWSRRENPQGYYATGFEIITISEEARQNLARLMEFVTLG